MASDSKLDVELGLNDEASNKDELQFQDFTHEEEEIFSKNSQTHNFTEFPQTAESDEDEITDKSGLLKEEKKISSFWQFEYYQQFFDVDTKQVLNRVAGSMLPIPGRNYLVTHIRPKPDLYGPFWICLTLVFTTAIAGNLANYLQSASIDYKWKYDFHKVTFAATAIFGYWWLIPLALYGLLWWRSTQTSVRYTFLEIICVYGYSLAIYIPISILWVIQVNWLQWVLVSIGAILSGSVLLITFWPAVKEDAKRVAMVIMVLIFIFHAALAVGFVLYFFHVPSTSSGFTPTTPTPNVTMALQNLNSHVDNQQQAKNENINKLLVKPTDNASPQSITNAPKSPAKQKSESTPSEDKSRTKDNSEPTKSIIPKSRENSLSKDGDH